MNSMKFFAEGIKNLRTVGTLARSSKFVCREMVNQVDFSKVRNVVELGAGDGVITKHILRKMSQNSRLLTFEVNPLFCEKVNEIKDKRMRVVQDSAEHLGKYLKEEGIEEIDCVISAIPFVSLPDELAYRIVEACHQHMKAGAPYVQIHYSLLMKKMYQKIFGNVDVNWVPLNIPPAFVLVSEKR